MIMGRFQKAEIAEQKIPIVHQVSPTLNEWNKKSANLGAGKALFGTASQAHQP